MSVAGTSTPARPSATWDRRPRTARRSGLNPPASFSDSLQIPFAGLYFAASKGGLLIDGQVRWTFFQNDVSDANHGMSGQLFDAQQRQRERQHRLQTTSSAISGSSSRRLDSSGRERKSTR